MNEEEAHPVEGDTLILTDIVHDRVILGTGLPCGYKLQNEDQTFDTFEVEVTNIRQLEVRGTIDREILTLEKPNGDTVDVSYRGREPIAGTAGQYISSGNTQGATQRYKWEKLE